MSALADALGPRAVAVLALRAGGRVLRIPSLGSHPAMLDRQTVLVRLVGVELAADLITHFANSRVYIPKGPSAHNSRSNPVDLNKVAKLTRQGLSAHAIARKLGCSERTVYAKRRILADTTKGTKA